MSTDHRFLTENPALELPAQRTPEERATELVAVIPSGGGPRAVELRGPGLPPVCVFHAPNPALVREAAEAIRAFAAAVIREATGRAQRPVPA